MSDDERERQIIRPRRGAPDLCTRCFCDTRNCQCPPDAAKSSVQWSDLASPRESCMITTYVCKVCGAHKGAANHWYVLESDYSGTAAGERSIEIHEWDESLAGTMGDDPDVVAACGEQHVAVLVSRWLQHRSFEAVTP